MTVTTTGDESRKLAIAFSESSAQVPFDFETNRDERKTIYVQNAREKFFCCERL